METDYLYFDEFTFPAQIRIYVINRGHKLFMDGLNFEAFKTQCLINEYLFSEDTLEMINNTQ